jgi:hypothetical protein
MRESYIRAVSYGENTHKRVCSRISNLFFRESEIHTGLGKHYIVDLITGNSTSGTQIVSMVCDNHDIPVFVEGNDVLPIRDLVKRILEQLPPRCAVVLDIRDNIRLQKVRHRIAHAHVDLRYRRVVFCLANHEMPTGSSAETIQVPGSIDDKMSMLLYHIPDHVQQQTESLDCFRPLAEAMVDYDVFHPIIWRNVCVDGTLEEFLSTAMYQVVRRVRTDPGIGDEYPSFEKGWRSVMAMRLNNTLSTRPDAMCPSIHRVIPIGVLPSDAMQAMEIAIPKNIQNPYAITVQSSAVNDQCGKIAISQPMQYTVVNIHCEINPGLLVDVCRELREGHQQIVSEVQSVRKEVMLARNEVCSVRSDMNTKLTHMQEQLSHMATLFTQNISTRNDNGTTQCAKNGCQRIVTKRFRSGKLHRQCTGCIANK